MQRVKRMACLLTVVVLMLSILCASANAALFTFETQFDYEKADSAWLTDLVVKESMSELEQLAARLTIEAVPDYPYTETPVSFKDTVAYYCTLYALDETSLRAAYIYIFQMMGDYSYIIEAETSDEEIKEYLVDRGIVYPADADEDTLILARALYVALVTGALDSYIDDSSLSGVQLEKAILDYAAVISGIDTASLSKWVDGGNILSLDDFVLATSRLSLWTNGYAVTPQTPANEVYRQLAIMVIEEQGISASGNLTTEELKLRYMAAMLSQSYGVTVDSVKLGEAVEAGNVPFYMLQLLGQQCGLAIRTSDYTYEDAFYLVAEHSDIFDTVSDEFYADIPEYNVTLKYIRDSIWLYPTTYSGSKNADKVVVTVDGKEIKDSYYSQVPLNSALKNQTLTIKVNYADNKEKSECTYLLNVYQGKEKVPEQTTSSGSDVVPAYDSASSIVNGILSSFGINGDLDDTISSAIASVPSKITGVLSVLAPTFNESETTTSFIDISSDVFESLFGIIDTMGEHMDFDLDGIGGFSLLSLLNGNADKKEPVEFLEVSFVDSNVIPPSEIKRPAVPGVITPENSTANIAEETTVAAAAVEGTVSVQEESSYNVSEVDENNKPDSASVRRIAIISVLVIAVIAIAAIVVLIMTKKRK